MIAEGASSRLRETRPNENTVAGRLREAAGRDGNAAGEGGLIGHGLESNARVRPA
jgi:hypothetical protein